MNIKTTLIIVVAASAISGATGAWVTRYLMSWDDNGADLAAIEARIDQLEARRRRPTSRADGPASNEAPPLKAVSTSEGQAVVNRAASPESYLVEMGACLRSLSDESIDDETRRAEACDLVRMTTGPGRLIAIRALAQLDDAQAVDAVRDFVTETGNDRRSLRMAGNLIAMLTDTNAPGSRRAAL
jgi:hypothetical protein